MVQPQIILASSSQTRKDLMDRLGINYILTENPEESVLTLFSRDTTALDNPVDSDATSEMRVNVCIENAVDCTWSLVTRKYV